MMKVVVTGGAGFIGSHLAEALTQNAEVTVIDTLRTGKKESLQHLPVRFVQGDILDTDLLRQEFSGASCVFHQAADVSVPGSVANPRFTHETNSTGTLNVLLAARDAGVGKVVFASSAAVYGSDPTVPKREGMPPLPESPYAVSKLTGEQYCRIFTTLYGLPAVCLRYFNVYGPRQDPHSPYAAVIPSFITRLLNDKPVTIYGDGEQTRDFIYVQDVVQANLRAMASEKCGIFNIASGSRTSVRELFHILEEISGMKQEPIYEPARPGDVHDSYADISRAREDLGFRQRYTLRRGLEETVAFFRARPGER